MSEKFPDKIRRPNPDSDNERERYTELIPNKEQVELLRRSVREWGEWREKNPADKIDLANAELSNTDLANVDLSYAYLPEANLSGANLFEANLSYAELDRANLSEADLSHANLTRANLSGANLFEAKFSGADLTEVSFDRADVTGADFTGAKVYLEDLRYVKGLDPRFFEELIQEYTERIRQTITFADLKEDKTQA